MSRSSHRPADYERWHGAQRWERRRVRLERRFNWPPTEELLAATLAEDPLVPPLQAAAWHPTHWRQRRGRSVASGPGRLP